MEKQPQGYVLYDGPSLIDGATVRFNALNGNKTNYYSWGAISSSNNYSGAAPQNSGSAHHIARSRAVNAAGAGAWSTG